MAVGRPGAYRNRQVHLVRGDRHRIGWIPAEHARVGVSWRFGWNVVEAWHATRERAGEKGNEHWRYEP